MSNNIMMAYIGCVVQAILSSEIYPDWFARLLTLKSMIAFVSLIIAITIINLCSGETRWKKKH
jgi:hypothetical protein